MAQKPSVTRFIFKGKNIQEVQIYVIFTTKSLFLMHDMHRNCKRN